MSKRRRMANRPLTWKALEGLRRLVDQVESVHWEDIDSTAARRSEGDEHGNDFQTAGA